MCSGAPAVDRRADAFSRLRQPHDLLVIGGGVNGLAVAWDAALAGLRVAVVEKGDWGSGTSSWSSRMIHGGLKYLEKLDLPMVRESLRDREWLLRRAPHLVRPLPFLLPFYRDAAHSPLSLRTGMVVYDLLSHDKSLPRHRTVSRAGVVGKLPGVRRDGLRGAARYFDAQVEYAERLCVELMLGARQAGATTVNHARVAALTLAGDRVTGAQVVDERTGQVHPVTATVTINVTGAWTDDLLADTPAGHRQWIGGTKGTHLVVDPFDAAPDDAMYYESDDGRPMMVIPWLGRYLIGSTDQPFHGDLDTASAGPEEISYILHETNRLFPGANLTTSAVRYSYTGVRPLPHVAADRPADITRRHQIHDHAPQLEGLLTVVGGKLTTFRALAGHALTKIRRKLGMRRRPAARLSDQRLPGYAPTPPDLAGALPAGLVAHVVPRWYRRYGAQASHLAGLATAEPGAARLLDPDTGLVAAEVLHAVRHEQAVRLADVLARRVMDGLEPDLGRTVAPAVCEVMGDELGWDTGRRCAELAAYGAYLRRFDVPPEATDGVSAGH